MKERHKLTREEKARHVSIRQLRRLMTRYPEEAIQAILNEPLEVLVPSRDIDEKISVALSGNTPKRSLRVRNALFLLVKAVELDTKELDRFSVRKRD